ncbi:MAG: FG-GAP repeat domain-containing protein [Syntrophobacteraceae bacterium]
MVDERKPSVCAKRLLRVPGTVMKAHSLTFYGVFDLDEDGSPEVFLDYWFPLTKTEEDNVVLLVYKKLQGRYHQYLKLKAQSMGYAPDGWFLKEKPHPKAIFMTRYGGSSGMGLFYLNVKKKSLDLISDGVFIECQPVFEDLDGDGMAEIHLPGRGRDRTSQLGTAILHWNNGGYEVWWPNWPSEPYVMYARLLDLDKDGKKEIVAVLDPSVYSDEDQVDGKFSKRELGVWKVENSKPLPFSKTEIPMAKYLAEPYFSWEPPSEEKPDISLSYTRTLGCVQSEGKIICQDAKELELPTIENKTTE